MTENKNPNTAPFPETADIDTSSDDYATRFSGKTGAWMLKVQEEITLRMMKAWPGAQVLDVGGGHGQLAIPLCREGYKVTVLGSAESCRHRIRDMVDSGACRFAVGNVVALPFKDKAFDVVVSFRMVTHCNQWPQLIKELSRVARNAVIVDYPTSQSANAIAPLLFEAKKKVEKNTRTWRLFKHEEVLGEFEKNGYAVRSMEKQFFLPMVLHRMLKSESLSGGMEKICRAMGLTRLWGSPVILCMTPGAATPAV
ncbi:MAG: class I SAM-dependent methyltransferase [Lentisphaerota bacterium]